MRLAKITDIILGERQRKSMDKTKLQDLRLSILGKGLLHPIVVNGTGRALELVAGERRYTVIKAIAEEGLIFFHDGEAIQPGDIPYSFTSDLSNEELFELEFEENFLREDLTWQDRVRALAQLHEMRLKENPTQTDTQTAQEVVDRSPADQKPGLSTTRRDVMEAKIILPHLNDPAIAKARNQTEAAQLVLAREQQKYQAELLRKKIVKHSVMDVTVRQGDMLDLLPKLDAGRYDLILTDPPYGLNAGASSYRDRTLHHHNYNDTPENARNILRCLLTEGWRVCKTNANIMIFTDIVHWSFLCSTSSQMGWDFWKWPIIWQKSENEGLAPWGNHGFAHTYDIAFFARKGQRGTNRLELDILTEKRVSRSLRTHAAEKPLALMELIVDFTTAPGDYILDPCAGSGTTLVAAKRMKRHALGIELDRSSVDLATVRIEEEAGLTQELPPAWEEDGMPTL